LTGRVLRRKVSDVIFAIRSTRTTTTRTGGTGFVRV
jgi:hypothetical protein